MIRGRFNRLVLTGCCAVLLVSCSPGDGETDRSKQPAKDPVPVRVTEVGLRAMDRVTTVTGTLAARESSTLSAKVPGRLARMLVDIGSKVRAGEVVAELDPRDYELRVLQAGAALAQARVSLGLAAEGEENEVNLEQVSSVALARALLDEAARNLERVRQLSQSEVASQSEFDAAESAHAVAAARHELAREEARARMAALTQRRVEHDIARKQLGDSVLRAPHDGVIQGREASPGEYVAVGTPIVTLVQTDPLRLRLEVPERESTRVDVGQTVRLLAEGHTNSYSGTIARLSPALNERSRTLLVEADVPNPGALRPGLFVRAQIIVQAGEQGLSMPAGALVTFAGIEKAVTVVENKAREKQITTGRRGVDWVEVTGGLAPGEIVVLNPAGLQSGQPVTILTGDQAGESGGGEL